MTKRTPTNTPKSRLSSPVSDEKTANWVVRKITGCDDEEKRIEEFAQKEINRVRREREFFLFRFGRQLEEFAKFEIAKVKGRRKSIRLPNGTLSFRSEGPKLVIDNEQAVILWAKTACPDAVQVSERLLKSAVNAHFESSGELPPEGIHIEPERERFSIR